MDDNCKVERQSQVSEVAVTLNNRIGILEDTINNLEARLSHVIRPQDPSPINESPCEATEPYVHFAEELVTSSNRVFGLDKRVQSILARLEI